MKCQAVVDAVEAAVIQRIRGFKTEDSHGVSVYAPASDEVYLGEFDDVADVSTWRDVLQAYYQASAAAAGAAPHFEDAGCAGCATSAGDAKLGCDNGAIVASKALAAGSAKSLVSAQLLVAVQPTTGPVHVIAQLPAKVSAKGDVEAKWSQDVLSVRQGGKRVLLLADTTLSGAVAIHEVPMLVAGPAACPCVLPGDLGFWDSDGDGSANCVDPDDDNDGVPDIVDVCPFVPDAAQADANKDGKGDACATNANLPTPSCKASTTAPFGPERKGTLVVVTHRIQGTTLGVSAYVQALGGVSEETLKGHHRLRPMTLVAAADGKGFQWVPGDPLPMRPDQPLTFSYEPLFAGFEVGANNVIVAGSDGKPIALTKALGVEQLLLLLNVQGPGGFGATSYWQGNKAEGVGPCPPPTPSEVFCTNGQIVDCDGKCWPQQLWGDASCDSGQAGKPNFDCEALQFDQGVCLPPECPGQLGLIRDCNGVCNAIAANKGDGVCHDGANPAIADLACAKFAYDGGDCPCPKNCFGHGTCNAGVCTCLGGWQGSNCDQTPSCGNGTCGPGENCATCAKDCGVCGPICGDGTCDSKHGETCTSCAGDCGACTCGDGYCTPGSETCTSCSQDCGACPSCGDEVCALWSPSASFTPATGEHCYDCAGDCGPCQGDCCAATGGGGQGGFAGGGCANATVTQCVCAKDPSCCNFGWSAACVSLAKSACGLSCCQPSCGAKVCGPDGCGGSCGGCDDGDPCTADVCDAKAGTCSHAPTTGPCDDGDPCTINSSCVAGVCGGGAPNCQDDPCTVKSCNQGVCTPTGPTNCNDGNACTDDSCQPGKGCVATPNTAACDDGNACTANDACAAGACKAGGLKAETCDGLDNNCNGQTDEDSCDDKNGCTTDSCADISFVCIFTPTTDACDDGDPCSVGDACDGGVCAGTIPLTETCGDGVDNDCNGQTDDGC